MEWINVKDKKPSYHDTVLIYNTEGAILIGRRYINMWTAFFADGEAEMGDLAATHWMPLPEPPKK